MSVVVGSAGCATVEERRRARITPGISQEQVRQILGEPREAEKNEGAEIWTYMEEGAGRCAAATDPCKQGTLRVMFDPSGRVVAIRFAPFPHAPAPPVDPCFVATAVYRSEQCGKVQILRRFRDEVLLRTALGRLAVKGYYRLSPPVARWLCARPFARQVIKPILDLVVHLTSRRSSTRCG
jgi:SmpA / OmlA family